MKELSIPTASDRALAASMDPIQIPEGVDQRNVRESLRTIRAQTVFCVVLFREK